MSAVIYHPGLDRTEVVHPEAVPQHRLAGWMLLSEHLANQAAAEEAAQDKAPAKAAKSEEK